MNSLNKIYLDQPAKNFIESLLIGDGRLGACVYGEPLREQLVLNESSVWSGSAEETDRQGAAQYLPKIRQLLREGRNFEAQELFNEHFTCDGKGTYFAHGTEVPFGCYQMLGRLLVSYFQAVSSGRPDAGEIKNYRRVLDLKENMATVSFESWGKQYVREYMVSADYRAIYVHLTCSEPGQIDFSCGLDREEKYNIRSLETEGLPGLYMSGQLEDGCGTDNGVCYGCGLTVKTNGGQIIQEPFKVRVKEADEAWIIITAATDLSGFMGKESCNPENTVLHDLHNACAVSWQEVLKKNKEWYSPQFESMELFLEDDDRENAEGLTTKALLQQAVKGKVSPALIELYVQYARYQMITCSQPGGFPANLQGIWSDEILTPWNGDWHLNAQQMIYWIVEKGNLSAHHMPYLRLTEELVKPGEKTAQTYYGAKGWLVHTCTNPWGFTSPCEDASWGSTTGSPAWQCHHLWEHYLYTLDENYLAWAYPIMKGAMLFYLDIMVENEKGFLVTSPSSSPENWFLDEDGNMCALCEGPAYDRELILALADSCICACRILKTDEEFRRELEEVYPKLAPVEIGSDGRIMEWSEEYPEPLPYHRHISHLWGVYPGNLISKERTSGLGAAAEKSLVMRGMTTAGWAIAFRGCLYARLRNGEKALECFENGLKYATSYSLMNLASHCDETLAVPEPLDLENCRYPFQMDGNQGNAANILLMLLDDYVEFCEDGTVIIHLYLLPALPKALTSGRVRGLRAKGNLTVDIEWKDGVITDYSVMGEKENKVVVHMGGNL